MKQGPSRGADSCSIVKQYARIFFKPEISFPFRQNLVFWALFWARAARSLLHAISYYFLFSGAFEKLRKTNISYVLSVRASVIFSRKKKKTTRSHGIDFHEILYLRILRKSVKKVQVLLKSDRNKGHITRRPMNVYDNISINSS
jgi:hypothetical protein